MSGETEYLGCGDGGCVIERPKGMHTNGGCRCLQELPPNKRVRVRKMLHRQRESLALARRLAERYHGMCTRAGVTRSPLNPLPWEVTNDD